MKHGIILLDKPLGVSSNFALQKVRRALGADKAGHSGTLDPMATGLLPIGVGHGTKALAYLLDADKRYVTQVRLGQTTSTGDAEGEILSQTEVPVLSESLLQGVLSHFRGKIQQIPPMYSAVKQNGVRLYHLAREGQEVDRQAREISLFACDLLSFSAQQLELQVWCSKGTYIRVLAEDIGRHLGCGAHLTALRRIGVAGFDSVLSHQLGADDWCPWSAVLDKELLDAWLLPMDHALSHYPSLSLDMPILRRLFSGQKISANDLSAPVCHESLIRLYDDAGGFYGLGRATPFQGLMLERWMSDPL
jgi:tRNA pseudouridine55 synthase